MKWYERLRVKLKRSTLVWAVPLAVAGLIAVFIAVNWGTTEHKKGTTVDRITVDSCKQIRLGMTKDQVLKIMPEPVGIISYKSHGREREKLLFPSPAAASTPPQSVIDQSTGQVEEVICDDNYRLSQKQP
ncbi:MAG: hypothetical protein V3U33_02205 [candidate division NC10 bacterium]